MSEDALLGIAPRLNDGLDLPSLRLAAADGFLLSQIDGVTPARVLAEVVALDPPAIVAALHRLEKLGAVTWAGAAPHSAAGVSGSDDPSLSESCDLSRDERLRILEMERRLPKQSFWELLGLAGSAGAAEIKRAYFAACKSYHPDRYYGRDLGSFAARIERIFLGIKKAYDTLADDAKREAYRKKHPPPADGGELAAARAEARAAVSAAPQSAAGGQPAAGGGPEEMTPAAETEEERLARLEKRRQEINAQRRMKRWQGVISPPKQPVASTSRQGAARRAAELYACGLAELQAGHVFAATASLKLAMTYDSGNARYQAMFEECNGKAMLERARQLAEEGAQHEACGENSKAAASFSHAFELAPSRVDYAVQGANAFLRSDAADKALRLARQALEVSPHRADARLAAAEALEALGDPTAALQELQAVDRLDNDDGRVKKAIRRLSRSAG